MLTNNDGIFHSSIYCKPTFTGIGLHFLSFIPYSYKINSVKTLIARAYNLCSTWTAFHNDFLCLCNKLHLFDKIAKTFLCMKFTNQQIGPSVIRNYKYVKLPCMGDLSYGIRKQFKILLQILTPSLSFLFVFSNSNTIAVLKTSCKSQLCFLF